MTEWIFSILCLCIFATILCKVSDHYNKEFSLYIAISVIVVVSGFVFLTLSPISDLIEELFTRSGLSNDFIIILFKSVGICYITELSSEICKDNGQGAISVIAELSGKIALIVVSLPLTKSIIEIITDLSAY